MSSYYVKNLPAIDVLMGVNIYEGFMIGEIREGPGRYKWADGQVTIGYWKNGQSCEFEAECKGEIQCRYQRLQQDQKKYQYQKSAKVERMPRRKQ